MTVFEDDDLERSRIHTLHSLNLLDTAPETEFENIIDLVKASLNAEMAAISLIDSDRQWFKAIRGLEVSETSRSVAFCDHTIRKSDVLAVENTLEDDRFSENPLTIEAPGLRCYLGAPLIMSNGHRIGSMCILGTEPRTFTDAEKGMMRSFAALVVSQIELRQIALTDGLSGLMTRTTFIDQLRATMSRVKVTGIAACLMMVDIDHFKAINDTYGHAVGDRVIQAVATILRANCREEDRAGRLGGEEFGVLLRCIKFEDMRPTAERMRAAVEALTIEEIPSLRITVSMGVAQLDETIVSVTDWLEIADRRLYQAKHKGRNTVIAA